MYNYPQKEKHLYGPFGGEAETRSFSSVFHYCRRHLAVAQELLVLPPREWERALSWLQGDFLFKASQCLATQTFPTFLFA